MTCHDAVVIGDPSGLLVLGRRDGSVLLDYADPPREEGEHLFFDRGSYTIQASGGRAWSGDTRKAAFVAKCGDRLVYFNGRTMAVFGTDPWKLRQAVRYEAAVQRRSSSPARYGAEFHLDGMDVRLEGTVYLRK